ncbi:hypothetical protein Tco_0911637 [Tanacetum coccineum]|uniref:Transposase (Putative), gypsy type n=1 Tax=Tanacetum coccineum TaxID=301880 RepID=A0ABQ5CXU7_9ASTR
MTNNCRLDTLEACQDMVDHTVPPGYFSKLCHLPNTEFLGQYNMNLARQVAMGSQLMLRFEQEVMTVETEVHGLRNRTQNLETLLEAEVDMKKVAEAKNADLAKELESLRSQFSDLQVNNNQLSQQYEDDKVEQRCTEMDARLDRLSIDFDEELYPHMLTVIVGRRWVIGHGLCLAVMKCVESTELRQVFADVVSVGIVKGMSEGLKHGALKDLKFPLVDQLEKLKDAPIDLIMTSLHLEGDSREDAPQWIHELRPSSAQLKIPVYPEVRDPKDPWSIKEEILLEDAIAANISHAEKTKKFWVVCRTHRIGSAHHARSNGLSVSMPTVAPQGLAILLADAATQTEISEDEASPRLLRSKSLPPMYNFDWP